MFYVSARDQRSENLEVDGRHRLHRHLVARLLGVTELEHVLDDFEQYLQIQDLNQIFENIRINHIFWIVCWVGYQRDLVRVVLQLLAQETQKVALQFGELVRIALDERLGILSGHGEHLWDAVAEFGYKVEVDFVPHAFVQLDIF